MTKSGARYGFPASLTRKRLAFLYGDLGLDQRRIAELLGTGKAAVARAVKELALKYRESAHGPHNREAYARFRQLVSPTSEELADDIPPQRLWFAIRVRLRQELSHALEQTLVVSIALKNLDKFLADLPHILKAAEARLTTARLKLLYGEFRFRAAEIAALLDVPLETTKRVLAQTGIIRGEPYLGLLDDELALAHALGRAGWPEPNYGLRDSDLQMFIAERRSVRNHFKHLALTSRFFDWSAVDRFLADEQYCKM